MHCSLYLCIYIVLFCSLLALQYIIKVIVISLSLYITPGIPFFLKQNVIVFNNYTNGSFTQTNICQHCVNVYFRLFLKSFNWDRWAVEATCHQILLVLIVNVYCWTQTPRQTAAESVTLTHTHTMAIVSHHLPSTIKIYPAQNVKEFKDNTKRLYLKGRQMLWITDCCAVLNYPIGGKSKSFLKGFFLILQTNAVRQ